jgi:hypothetical protein
MIRGASCPWPTACRVAADALAKDAGLDMFVLPRRDVERARSVIAALRTRYAHPGATPLNRRRSNLPMRS